MAPLIAVLDDDPAFLNLMNILLGQEGYRTVTSREERDALAMIRRERPDLLIMDLRMLSPRTGWLLLDELRRHPDTAALPVIVCSGDGDALRENAGVLRERRCVALAKPFDLEDLLEKVRSSIGTAGSADESP